MISSETVSNANDRPRHLITFHIDQMQKVSSVIMPSRIIAQKSFVQYAAIPLMGNVGYPYASNAKTMLLRAIQDLVP